MPPNLDFSQLAALEWYKIIRKDNQVLPNPIWLIAQQIDYLMPWYDPVKEGSTEDAVSYLSQSPAAKRAELQAVKIKSRL